MTYHLLGTRSVLTNLPGYSTAEGQDLSLYPRTTRLRLLLSSTEAGQTDCGKPDT